MTVPVIAAAIAGTGLAITLVVLLVRGGFLLDRLVKQVETQEAKIDALTAAVQQTNAILVGLANHTHDADGRTVFTSPPETFYDALIYVADSCRHRVQVYRKVTL